MRTPQQVAWSTQDPVHGRHVRSRGNARRNRGCRIALRDSVSTPSAPEHGPDVRIGRQDCGRNVPDDRLDNARCEVMRQPQSREALVSAETTLLAVSAATRHRRRPSRSSGPPGQRQMSASARCAEEGGARAALYRSLLIPDAIAGVHAIGALVLREQRLKGCPEPFGRTSLRLGSADQ